VLAAELETAVLPWIKPVHEVCINMSECGFFFFLIDLKAACAFLVPANWIPRKP
jgi:hypothetical protein